MTSTVEYPKEGQVTIFYFFPNVDLLLCPCHNLVYC